MQALILLTLAIITALIVLLFIYIRAKRLKRNISQGAIYKAEAEQLNTKEDQKPVFAAEEAERQRLSQEVSEFEEELPKPDKECHKAEGEREAHEGEAYKKGEETQRNGGRRESSEAKADINRVEPDKRGGRPRVSAQNRTKQPQQVTKPYRPKPEIVCWKREREWIPAVEVPEDLLVKPGLQVLQDGSPLRQDESREDCWHLGGAYSQAIVRWHEDEVTKDTNIAIEQKGYLLFKLGGQNQTEGHLVRFPSSGSYLVVVPQDWERNEALSGPPPIAPEPVSLVGYRCHFFYLERQQIIAFLKPTGESTTIDAKMPRFELVGTRLKDASEYEGPLFAVRPPQVCARDQRAWRDIRTIVVGQEGGGKSRWRVAFSPTPALVKQDLPSEVANRRGGWCFLRLYDANDDLVESLTFRFLCSLKEIRILQPSPFPSADGHSSACIEFLHEPGCAVDPAEDLVCSVQVERKDNKTILTVPPDPAGDQTSWLVRCAGELRVEVKVTVLVERIWWAIGEENCPPSTWEDRPLSLMRTDFSATSKKTLWLRVPKRRWADKVLVGFEQWKARPYDVRVTERTIAVPLREFGDSSEASDCTRRLFLSIWVERSGEFSGGVVAVIPASQSAAWAAVPATSSQIRQWIGFGKKKTAIAKVVLLAGQGDIKVNGQPVGDYFKAAPLKANYFLQRLLGLDRVREALSHLEVLITVTGSTPRTTRQVKASAHGIARALMSYDPLMKSLLKQEGFGGAKLRGLRKKR